ncbi:MAG: ATP-dependent DNA ligase [Bacteroidota bacterium]
MNVQGVKDDVHLGVLFESKSYIAQIKLDGMRAVVHITTDGLRIFSRSAGVADPTKPLEKTTSLPHLASLKFPDLLGTVLDCEILVPGKDSAELSGLVHRKEVDSDNTNVKLFVFDILSVCGRKITHKSLRYRLSELLSISHKLQSEHIVVLPYSTTPIQKRKLYDKVIASGGEGIMLKNLDAAYIEGERPSNNWYKAKKSATYDCVVTGFSKGKGKYNTQIGAVRFGQYVEGKLIELGQASGMSDDIRKDMSINPKKYLGKVVSIKGIERLKSGAIRHPQFGGIRIDKHPLQCIWYKNEQ